jgi:hypothetical protein
MKHRLLDKVRSQLSAFHFFDGNSGPGIRLRILLALKSYFFENNELNNFVAVIKVTEYFTFRRSYKVDRASVVL